MAENPRIEGLRRRVERDPASIAFAQLAEEYRRTGSPEDAIAVCRSGLEIHPNYLSARVTLGRALLEVGDLDAAVVELELVLRGAPENLAAIRGLAEIHKRKGEFGAALELYRSALALAPHDPDLEHAVEDINKAIASRAVAMDEPTPEATDTETNALPPFVRHLEKFLDGIRAYRQKQAAIPPVLPRLERFLDAIHAYRQKQAV